MPDPHWLADEIELGWYGRAIRQRWKWLVAGALLSGTIAVASTFLRPVLYEGITTLLVVPPPKAPTVQMNPATFRAVLQNGSIATQVISELKLNEPPHNLTPQIFIEDALDVEQLAGTNVVRVGVKLSAPALAAEASRRVARKAVELTQELNQQEGAVAQEQLKNHLTEAFQRFNTAEKELVGYQQQAQVELVREDAQAMLNERKDLLKLTIEIESEKARLRSAEQEIKRQDPVLTVARSVGAERALRRASENERSADRPAAPSTVPPPPGASPTPTTSDRQRASVDAESLDLTNPIVNPVYQTLDFQISTSRSRLAALEQERREIAEVRKIGGAELAKLNELYRAQIQLARLQTNLDLAKKVYSDLVLRSEEARTQAFGNSPQLQLVDEAFTPDRPLSAGRLRALLLGLIAGVLGAGLIALGLEGHEMRKQGQGLSA